MAATIQSLSGFNGVHGQSVTFGGLSFGSSALPLKFDDGTGGTTGASMAGNGWHVTTSGNVGGGAATPKYEIDFVRHARNARSGQCKFPYVSDASNDYLSSFGLSGNTDISTEIYFDFYCLLDQGASPTQWSRNWKIWRVHAGDEQFPNAYISCWDPLHENPSGTFPNAGRMHFDQDVLDNHAGSATQGDLSTLQDARDFNRVWRHFQVRMKQSTLNTANGTVWIAIDNVVEMNRTNVISRDDTDNGGVQQGYHDWQQVLFGNYMGHDFLVGQGGPSQHSNYVNFSDVYVAAGANACARVEIGDGATYATCTHREIQIPTSWSSTSIQVTLNLGSFPSFSGLKAYVVDSTNTPSAGFPLDVSGPRLSLGGGCV